MDGLAQYAGAYEKWMSRALVLARQARAGDEVPIGAVIIRDGRIIGEGFNQPRISSDPTAHAEIVALRAAAKLSNNYRLPGAVLYVTIEPCTMCVGAMIHARLAKIVFGAREPRAGALISHPRLLRGGHLNHQPEVVEGILAGQCGELLSRFFQARRQS